MWVKKIRENRFDLTDVNLTKIRVYGWHFVSQKRTGNVPGGKQENRRFFLLKKADKNSNSFNGKMVADQFAILVILLAIFSAKMTVIIILG